MTILIADDHSVVREGLITILNNIKNDILVDEVDNGLEAYEKICKKEYDLIILDISLPGISGLEVLQRLKNQDKKMRILVMSMYQDEQYAVRSLKLGASGYIFKGTAYEEFELAMRKILAGGRYISSSLAERIIFKKNEYEQLPHENLSEREFQIFLMIAKGKSIGEIAKELFISVKTVSTHRMHILEKMGMKKNAELTLYAIKNGLIE